MKNVSGFTLIELLTNIVIIGILATISVSVIKGYAEDADRAKSQIEMSQIRSAVFRLQLDTNLTAGGLAIDPCVKNPEYHITDDDAGLLNNNGGAFPAAVWNGPYWDADGLDPWGTPYIVDHDYHCAENIRGCEKVCEKMDCPGDNAIVAAVTTAGPDTILNNYDSGEAIVVLCEP